MAQTGAPLGTAKDVMNKDIFYIDGMASVKDAAEQMRRENTTTLIVKKRNDADAWGMVTSLDMIRGVTIADKKAVDINIYEIMSKPLITVPSDMDIRYVAKLMNRVGIRRAPVEDCGELVGIVTQADLVMKSKLFE